METVIIVVHLMVIVALIAVVLLQRSEGGALGIGGGANAFLSGRGQANVLTRATTILGIADVVPPTAAAPPPAGNTVGQPPAGGILDQLNQLSGQGQTPAAGGVAGPAPTPAEPAPAPVEPQAPNPQ
jgi:preprotein translocase subunit SecG